MRHAKRQRDIERLSMIWKVRPNNRAKMPYILPESNSVAMPKTSSSQANVNRASG